MADCNAELMKPQLWLDMLDVSTVPFGCSILQVQCMLSSSLHADRVALCLQSTTALSAFESAASNEASLITAHAASHNVAHSCP